MTTVESLKQQIDQAMNRDRHRLRRRLQSIQNSRASETRKSRDLQPLQRAVEESVKLATRRRSSLPTISYPQDLPILDKRGEIKEALTHHQTIIVAGETGSGKSTQLPKICLEAGFGITGLIGHTQPRRIAARSIAARLADELSVTLGHEVGFKIRFTDRTNPDTYVKLMTDGILLAETQSDRFLERYDVIILDEAHERSMNVDFLLGYIKRLLGRRPELRLIVTSATIDPERFCQFFADQTGPVPVVEVSGRSYPVELRYRPLLSEDSEEEDVDLLSGIVQAVRELARIDRGHILVFLPTERDIRDTAKRLRAETLPGDGVRTTEIVPLYARLSAKEQGRVFQPNNDRRIVLATNVAESSLTVPGIRYVIDTGTARISRYAPRSKVQRLPIEAVSQASADQRKGRCGRVAPGVCIRLYSQEDYEGRARYTTPEIRRTNLASVILQAKALKLGPVEDFPFLDPPGAESLRDGYRTLFEIEAIDSRRELTPIGRRLSQLPVDPRIGRMILAAEDEDCLAEILIIASALEIQDPRERPIERQQLADEAHGQWKDEQSDFVSLLRLWDFYHRLKESLSRNKLRKACQQNFLSFNRMREWTEIQRQLQDLTTRAGMKQVPRQDDNGSIHRALLAGFLSGVAYRSGDHTHTGAGGIQLRLWPGSGLFQQKPKWIVAAELVETTQRYARMVARINPNWVEPIADHLVKRTYSDPHWHEKSCSAMAWERVTLFGLPLVARRRVAYGPIDPKVSRELFIQHGLVERQLSITDSFFVNNTKVLDDVTRLAAKTRSREYLVDDYAVYRFYDQRLPEDVYDLVQLRKWLRGSDHSATDHLHMSVRDFVENETATNAAESFPESLSWGAMELPVSYHFEPGSEQDGVTVTVPVEAAGQLAEANAGWLVPGLLEEKITALIRSLPKPIRRKLIPAPDTAKAVASQLSYGKGPFVDSVVEKLSAVAGEPISREAFRLNKLPAHLRMNFHVVGPEGNIEAQGRDVNQILQQLDVQLEEPADHVGSRDWDRDDITSWDFEELPKEIVVRRSGINVPAYPSLIDRGTTVQIRLLSSVEKSERLSRQGIMRLYSIAQNRSLRNQTRWLPQWDQLCLHAATVLNSRDLKQQLQDLIADRAFLGDTCLPRDQNEFECRLKNAPERISVATQDVAQLIPRLFESYHQAKLALDRATSDRLAYAYQDVSTQLQHLTEPGFLARTDWNWLCQYPRFFQAIDRRLAKLAGGPQAQDKSATAELAGFWAQYARQRDDNDRTGRYDAQLDRFRWMLEEYRVSLFAQPLGTSITVSAKRLNKQWAKVKRT